MQSAVSMNASSHGIGKVLICRDRSSRPWMMKSGQIVVA
jgi:hypothetical protein